MTTYDTKDTFWSGRREDDIAIVTKFIPFMGECAKDLPNVEQFRVYQKSLYRLYNDGDNFPAMRYRSLCTKVGIDWCVNGHRYASALEDLGDKLLNAALHEVRDRVYQPGVAA